MTTLKTRAAAWWPTWKWWTATITGAGTIVTVALIGDGINTDDEKILVIGIVVARLVAWTTPNQGGN